MGLLSCASGGISVDLEQASFLEAPHPNASFLPSSLPPSLPPFYLSSEPLRL
jgi:hypothetical protein